MGRYINPPDSSKEEFLQAFGIEISKEDAAKFDYAAENDSLPVVWVNNGPFTAAAIAFDQREMDDFQMPDPRPQQWFMVEKVLLESYL